jgi:transcriptional regulator with XRE-family HTH domain
VATPTRAKRRFGALLRELRAGTNLKAEQVTLELKGKGPMVSRYESGEAKPAWGTVLTMLALYGASDEQRALASRLWDEVNEEPQSVRLPTGAHSGFRKLVNAEREATRERVVASSVMPSLLQTKPYIEALLAAGHRLQKHKTRPESLIDVRLRRQERLDDDMDPLALVALIDEAAIRRIVGGPDVLRQQLAHLLVVAERPNVTLRVVPFEAGAYGTMNGSCVIIDYPEPEPTSGVYLEYPAGGSWVDNPEDVQRFTSMFDDVTELAYTPADTTNLIHEQIRALQEP